LYPRTYYETFMRYEANDQVFVAMPFSTSFKHAFEHVIEPAIRRVMVNGRPLVPRIINRGTSGSPDIHEQIFDAILHSRLVVADMTVQSSYKGDDGALRWQPNANVAYEVGLASAWRNPEDILLIHQGHPNHSYSFDIQNLRHIQYDPKNPSSITTLVEEIVRAINQSSFLAKMAYQKLLESVSPSALQFMHQEARRAFPVVSFQDTGMPILDARIHAATELLSYGALKNRNVIPQGAGKGVAVIYEWTEIGLRMLLSLHAVTSEPSREMRMQIASVPSHEIPPPALRDIPEVKPPESTPINMVEATKVDTTNEAAQTE
jgi:hypothetical protein